jgi:hypothetical protein
MSFQDVGFPNRDFTYFGMYEHILESNVAPRLAAIHLPAELSEELGHVVELKSVITL